MLDLVGQQFGYLTVVREVERNGHIRRFWCRCRCGTEWAVDLQRLRRGATKSCGCWHREVTRKRLQTHGESRTPEFIAWWAMKQRCFKPTSPSFPRYGGRGITVCAAWREVARALTAPAKVYVRQRA